MKALELSKDRRLLALLCAGVLAMAALTVGQDRLYAAFNGTSFFLSESAMFSSFWLLFVPLLFLQYQKLKIAVSAKRVIAWILSPVLIHLLLFPLLIWLLSTLVYYHTFEMLQTLQYVLSEHSYTLLLLYSGCGLFVRFRNAAVQMPPAVEQSSQTYVSAIVVSSGGRYVPLAVADIAYIRAATPYVTIHLAGKQYLHTETLKSIAEKLDNRQFVRIHKSCIVNVTKVVSYQSRLNGDYDIQMQDGTCIRLSRSYARRFKETMALRSD